MRIYGITDRTLERLAELLAFPAFSLGFWALYLFCGLTDMADGPVARRTGSANAFGARLDTAADAVFLAAALGKLLPVLAVPGWLWVWLVLIAAIKIGNLLWGFRHGKGLAAAHTARNRRLTGIVLFLLPLTLPWAALRWSAVPVCALATAAAVQEGRVLRGGMPRIPPAGGNGGKQRGGDDL